MSEREILFRGKIIELCKYQGQWLEGFFGSDNGKTFIAIQNENGLNGYFCDSKTVGQYTGLTDKNGTRIFEGDIVKTSHGGSTYYAKIEWDDGSFWVTNHDIQMPSYISEVSKTYLEVIGNIHDNPELLNICIFAHGS